MAGPSAKVSVKAIGLRQLITTLGALPQETFSAVGLALYEEASQIAERADLLVPYDTGALARSQIVHPPVVENNAAVVEISYGGPAAPYAVVQHENLEFRHPSVRSGLPLNGRQAKYLEEPFVDRIEDSDFPDEFSERIEAALIRAVQARVEGQTD